MHLQLLSPAFSALLVTAAVGVDAQDPGYSIPIVDLAHDHERIVIIDEEPGQYLGRPTTVLLEDGATMPAVYPKGHGKGGADHPYERIVLARFPLDWMR